MYVLKARFSKSQEKPIHPFVAHNYRISKIKNEINLNFSFKPTLKTIKTMVKNHYSKHNGSIEGLGKILYYSFFKDNRLIYDIDVNGEVVNNYYFKDLIIEMYFKNSNEEIKQLLKKEMVYLNYFMENYIEFYSYVEKIINEIDPFMISEVSSNEYEYEVKEITISLIGRNLSKKKIYKKVKRIFEKWFLEDETRNDSYWQIANKIYDYYIEKKESGFWEKIDDIFVEGKI